MIGSLFKLSSVKEEAVENNKNDAQEALKPHMHTDMLMQADDDESPAIKTGVAPKNLDELSVAARELLMDTNLEVSKVRPFFWSMVETYLDRFQIYPFDVVKALFSYLESKDYPADQMQELVKKLEECYQQQHGEPMRKSTRLLTHEESLDDEIRELRASLKYAALVGELEEEV